MHVRVFEYVRVSALAIVLARVKFCVCTNVSVRAWQRECISISGNICVNGWECDRVQVSMGASVRARASECTNECECLRNCTCVHKFMRKIAYARVCVYVRTSMCVCMRVLACMLYWAKRISNATETTIVEKNQKSLKLIKVENLIQ